MSNRLTNVGLVVGIVASLATVVAAAATYLGIAAGAHWWPFEPAATTTPAPISCGQTSIRLDPPAGPVGTEVRLHGCAFGPDEDVQVTLAEHTIVTAHTDATGEFDASFPISSDFAGRGPVQLTVIAQGQTSQLQRSAQFALTR